MNNPDNNTSELPMIRHVLPEFGRVPVDLETESMSGIVKVAVTLAVKQAVTRPRVQLWGLNRDYNRRHYTMAGVDVFTHPGFPLLKMGKNDWRYFVPMYLSALRSRVDILHVHDNPFLLALPRAKRRVLHYNTPISPRISAAFVQAQKKADLVICSSKYLRDDLLQYVNYPQDRVYVLYNGVDIKLFDEPRQDLRRKLGISKSTIVLLYAGQISKEKGLIHVIRAMRILTEKYPIHLLVAGSSTLWQSINASDDKAISPYEIEVHQASIGLPVNFLGKVPSSGLSSIYHAADIFVCPSEWPEPFGIVNVEAMASGKPVVASRVGGIPEIVVDGVTGFLTEPANSGCLVQNIQHLIDNPTLRLDMGIAGKKRAAQIFSWDTLVQQLDQIYLHL